jgi:nucleoside-diphosphate-sugar epimerase
MKIIVTGCTGVVGSEVVRSAIKHQFITHIYAVTRKPLDPQIADHPKVTQIIHEDFESWPDHLLRLFEHEGVRGCIW